MKAAVGDKWAFTAPNGSVGEVWLERRCNGIEVWNYSFRLADGSGYRQDWAPTRRKAAELCSLHFGRSVRFVRLHSSRAAARSD